jgi:hypothetical protein
MCLLIIVSLTGLLGMTAQQAYTERALTGMGGLDLTEKGGITLQQEALAAFTAMQLAALKDGIHLAVVSGYRSFERQKQLWNRKYRSYIAAGLTPQAAIEKITRYSTIPGTSRHHWGTDVDLIDVAQKMPKDPLLADHYTGKGVYAPLRAWLMMHAESYGFYLVYDNDPRRKGFAYEPWHYSYKPLSKPMLGLFLNIGLPAFYRGKSFEGKAYLTPTLLARYRREQLQCIHTALR